MGIVKEDAPLDQNSIRETVLKALGTQSFINQQFKSKNRLYIETPNKDILDVNLKGQSS